MLPVFSSVAALARALGRCQPWVCVPLRAAREAADRAGLIQESFSILGSARPASVDGGSAEINDALSLVLAALRGLHTKLAAGGGAG